MKVTQALNAEGKLHFAQYVSHNSRVYNAALACTSFAKQYGGYGCPTDMRTDSRATSCNTGN